jgi:hypothetical protein
MPVSLIPCDFCARKVPEKLCQTTWAWYRADNHRVAWRQRLCTQCFCTNVLPLDQPLNFEGLTCPACGVSTDKDMDPVYATSFLPGEGKQQLEIPLCASCAVEVRNRAMHGAAQLEDKPRVEGPGAGPSTNSPTTRESYWANLGIRQ